MRDTYGDVRRCVEEPLADGSAPRVLNLHGPLGVGKSRLAGEVAEGWERSAGERMLVLDGVDQPDTAASALALLEDPTLSPLNAPDSNVLVVSRRPIRCRPGWDRVPLRSFRLGPRSARDIRELAASSGVADPMLLDLVVDLAAGLPLIADVLARALCDTAHTSDRAASPETTPRADIEGCLADLLSREVAARLGTELADPPTDTLHVLAVLGGADADLMAAAAGTTAEEFDRISALSVVEADRLGRTVAEPFRTVFDLAYRWRHPVAVEAVLARASSHRRRRILASGDPAVRAELSDRVMRTAAHPRIRQAFFPPSAASFRARPATADDERDVIRLVRQWACLEGLDTRLADRMLDAWMNGPVSGFHLLFDAEGRAVSLANLTPIRAGADAVLEALLQQHAAGFAAAVGSAASVASVGSVASAGSSALAGSAPPSGHLVGMLTAASRRPAARGAMLRHILSVAIPSGRVVVSTSWPPYRVLAEDLGLRAVGETRDDLFGCGRRNRVLERTFNAGSLGPWLRRMERPDDQPDPLLDEVRNALGQLRAPRNLRDSPLLTLPGLAEPSALAGFLRCQIEELAASASTEDAEAGGILLRYFVRRNTGHDALIHQAHLSRATYFRRLDHGVRRVAEAARLLGSV